MDEQAQDPPQQEPATPQYFGDYEVIRSIGRGKFAIVYRAHKIGDDQNVALKRISVDMMNDKAREKTLKEVRVLQNLDHPNIIRYMDSFICDNDLIIVYEWAAAGDLKRQLRKAQEKGVGFEERVIWKYFAQISNAIQHMHEKRVMHRDLKPANIFLTLDGTIKVGDLGLSRELSENTFQAHSKVGTPLYMSPEVLKGDGYDFKTDIWSLGCLLYELAMLKSPFRQEGLNLPSLFQKISKGEYQPLPDSFSPELRTLCEGMMASLPADRPDIAHVCEVANRMRAQTAGDRQLKRTKSGTAQDFASTTGAPTSDAADPKSSHIASDGHLPEKSSVVSGDKAEADGAERRPIVRSRSEERKGGNPFQRGSSLHGDIGQEGPTAVAPDRTASNRFVERTDSEEKAPPALDREEKAADFPTAGVSLGDYWSQKKWATDGTPQEQQLQLDEYRSPHAVRSNNNAFSELRNELPIATAGDRKPLAHDPNHSAFSPPKTEQYSEHIQQSVQQQPPAASVYRRAKPPKGPSANTMSVAPSSSSSSVANGGGVQAQRISTAEAGSRPSSGAISRPSTVDHALGLVLGTNDKETSAKLMEALDNASPAFALMETVYAKLIVLGYPMEEPGVTRDKTGRGRLMPLHFAINTNAFANIAGGSGHYQFASFKRMVHVIQWLCDQKMSDNQALRKIVKNIDSDASAPMTTAKQLLQAAQAAGSLSEEMVAVTPSSITSGCGFNVCLVLNYFADCALKSVAFVVQPTVHGDLFDQADDAPDDDSMEEDELIAVDEEDDDDVDNGNDLAISNMSMSLSRSKFHVPDYVTNRIDPVLWKQETERVAAMLRKQDGVSTASWQHHLDLLVKYASEQINMLKEQSIQPQKTQVPQVNIDPMERPLGPKGSQSAPKPVEEKGGLREVLRQMGAHVHSDNQKMAQCERYLNAQPVFNQFGGDYARFKQERDMYEELSARSNESILQLTNALAEIEEQLSDINTALREKISGGEDGSSNRLLQVKQAMLQLQQEIRDMHMRSGIANEELIARQKQQLNYQQLMERRKSHRRHRKNRSGGADDGDLQFDST